MPLMMEDRFAGDQSLHRPDLIGDTPLNILEPRGGDEITAVEEKRFHICHEHIRFEQEIMRLCKLRSRKQIEGLSPSRHESSAHCMRYSCAMKEIIFD